MGRDRNIKDKEESVDHDHYSDQLNFTPREDDLFGGDQSEVETLDMDDSRAGLTPVVRYKGEKAKTKEDLKGIKENFEKDTEKIAQRHKDGTLEKDMEDAILHMEKVNLNSHSDPLNEEEKLIERSRIEEQRKLLEEYEDDRMKLLNMERREEDKMKYASSIMTNELLLEENRATIEVRENEARTFRSFAKKEERLKNGIIRDEGEIINLKKTLHFSKSKARSHLFGGSRDRVYSLRWNQTPQPLEVKVLMARKINEKLPKAHYALNVTIMDGFGGNEIFFKFSKDIITEEKRDKFIMQLKKEQQELQENLGQREESKSSSSSGSDDDELPKRRLKQPVPAKKPLPTRLEFLTKTLKRLENPNQNYMEKSIEDFDEKSLHSFLMPDIEHRRQLRAERNIDATAYGDTTMKAKMLKEFKQVMLNFQKNFSSLQPHEEPNKEEELEFCDKIYFLIPHNSIIEPSYIVMFELILLDEKLSSTSDRVVAWGAYPLLKRGKFKVPLIRGKYDPYVDKFKDIEGKYMRNIDEWICNLYFEMRDIRLVECIGHKEFMEFPVPSEVQAYLEGKINEEQLLKIQEKQNGVEGEGDSDSDEEKDLELQAENSRSQNLEDIDMRNGTPGKFMLNNSEDRSLGSDSDDENKTIYDVEGEDDVIADLRTVDLREYTYPIKHKVTIGDTEEQDMARVRYIFKELMLDIGIGRFALKATIISVIVMLLALWSRMYIHYLFQYIFLKLIDVPVTSTSIKLYRVNVVYGYWNVYQEVIAVISGPLGTTLFFLLLILLTYLGHTYVQYFPKHFAKFVVWFGFGSMGDGLLIAIVDTAAREEKGDFYKLPNYYEKAEDSPIAGYIVVCVVYIFFVVLNLLIFYNYIIYLHLNGRIRDIYIRLMGYPKAFFIPHDNELSLRHLLWCYYTAIVNSQRIVVNHVQIVNDYGEPCTVSTLQTSTYETSRSLEIARTFIRDEIG